MYKFLFQRVKKIIPKISETEIIALRSGGTSIDKYIFNGKMNYDVLYKPFEKKNIPITMEKHIQTLLKKYGPHSVYPNEKINEIMNDLGKNGFLSMIIDKKYGGNRLSIDDQSYILSKISSYNPSLGVVTMVPNSLGPAELLQHYGTKEQQEYYLPKLADGTFIPCFGLTGPNNGSDAVGNIDEGFVEETNGKIEIRIVLNKRYITLAPISNLIGIAFKLNDPHHLLNGKQGITLALIESDQHGLLKNTYHNPNHAGFPNGTIKGTIYISSQQVIGGEQNIGEGWKMLMECLAVGRGVSLPATANGSSKMITQSILNYINIRNQFNMNIGNMEAVKEKFIDMYINTWIIHSSVKLTNHILDSGSVPSVITAIMKQQTTERARSVLNHGMDIYSGSGICIGENNFFTKFYNSSPVGITVEGSNTLTRGLIIFGQGLNKSHPYIFPIFENIQKNDAEGFKNNFNALFFSICKNYVNIFSKGIGNKIYDVKRIFHVESQDELLHKIDHLTAKFGILTNYIALLGGKIKSKQMLSGNMADILSNLYLTYSLLWYHHHYEKESNLMLRDASIMYLIHDIEYKLNLVVENYPHKIFYPLLYPLKCKLSYPVLENKNKLYQTLLEDHKLYEVFKQSIYYEGTVLEKMEKLRKLEKNSPEYNKMYQHIIQVGEFPIQ